MNETLPKQAAYALFDTVLGQCGIVWRASRDEDAVLVVGFQLPEAMNGLAEARIERKWAAGRAPVIPPPIQKIIQRVRLHFNGKSQDFRDIELDLEGVGLFSKRVYEAARAIPPGQTASYGKIAEAAGHGGAARAVGLVMGRNPVPLIIPCHRILASNSRPGGFSAHGGLATKAKMLEVEGVTLGRPVTIRSGSDLARAAALLARKDPRLASILTQPIDFKSMRQNSPFHTLVRAVVSQQLSPKAADTILGRIAALYNGTALPDPDALLKMQESQLRAAGLSRSKAKSLMELAARALDGTIPSAQEIKSLGDEEIIKRLTSIHGVGRWTVEMMLIFNLARADVLPADDYALRKSIAAVLGMTAIPTPGEVRKWGEAWRPYRTVVSLYLWNFRSGNGVGSGKEEH